MDKLIWLTLLLTVLYSCGGDTTSVEEANNEPAPKAQPQKTAYVETPEVYVQRIVNLVKEGDNDKLFDEIYLFETHEVEALITEYANGDGLDRIAQMQESMLKTKPETMGHFKKFDEMGDWEGLYLHSVEFLDRPKLDPSGQVELEGNVGFRRGLITAHLVQNEQKYKLELPVADLNTGEWRLLKHPRLDKE